MWWRRTRGDCTEAAAAGELVEECEAFLAGTYGAYLQSRGRPVPAWAWINRLAHAKRDDLEALAAERARGSNPQALLSCIAGRLLSVVDHRDVSLETLQCRKLIPLELFLAATAGPAPLTDDDLARMITAGLVGGLDQTPSTRRPGQR